MKPALVLLHGWGAHRRVWDALAARLETDLQVITITPDLPGHGAAPAPTPYTIGQIIDQLADAAPAQCMVAGWSLGGQLALAWAQRHPRQVTRLLLLAATPRFVGTAGWPHGMASDVFDEFSAALRHDAAATLRRFLLLQARGDAQARAVARQLEMALALQPRPADAVLAQTLDWLRSTDLRAALPQIMQPALVIHGDCDPIAPPAAGEYLAAHLRHARLALLAGVAHVPFISVPDVICKLISEFCND